LRRPLLATELAAVRAEQLELAALNAERKLSVQQVAIMSAPLREREITLEAALARAERPSPLAAFTGPDPAEVWERLDLDRRRAVLAELLTITVHPAPKGRPAGWKPGQPYFAAGSVEVTWRQGAESPRRTG